MEPAQIIKSLREFSWRDRVAEDDVKDTFGAAADLLEKLLKENARLDRDEDVLIEQRDRAEEAADELAHAIANHFGGEIGEHVGGTPGNCPWQRALELFPRECPECGLTRPHTHQM